MKKSRLIEKRDLDNILKIRELVKDYPNDMELGGKVRELFLGKDSAGYPVKKINSYFTTDLEVEDMT